MRLLVSILILTLFGSFAPSPSKKTIKIVIDAGHGGSDPGHLSDNKSCAPEKEITLKIALYLGEYIEKYLTNVEVLYTRKDDTFPTLDERVDLANNNNVDYFLSIHCNGSPKKSIKGTESHIHNFSAKKSYALAKEIEREFSNRAGRVSRGIKNNDDRAHSIQVLKFTKMTSVLVECGFMTNAKEAQYLNTTHGQEILASAIFRAFRTRAITDFPEISFSKEAENDYAIQILSSKEPFQANDPCFRKLDEKVEVIKLNTKKAYGYKYLVGNYSSLKEAETNLKIVKKAGFPDAFVVKR